MLNQVKITLSNINLRLNKNSVADFWTHDYSFPIFNEKFKPVMPRIDCGDDNKIRISQAREALKILQDFINLIL